MLRDDIVSFKIGGAVHHINKPVQKFGSGSSYQLPMRFVGNIQGRIDIKEAKISVLPSVVFLQQGIASEVTFGTYIRCRFKNPTKLTGVKSETALNIGLFYRVNDAIIPQLNLDLGKFAIELGEKTHSDLILITDYSGAIKTNGARTADFIGAMLMRISMINPTPFCPSFDPCVKLKPAQLAINNARIHVLGG